MCDDRAQYRSLAKGYRFLAEEAGPEAKQALLDCAAEFEARADELESVTRH